MKSFGKMLAATLAVTLLLAGCAVGDVSWVFRSGDAAISPGLYIIYQIRAVADAEEKVAQEHASEADFTSPKPKELLKMTVEGQPVSDWVVAQAREKVLRHVAARQKFDELGLSLTESDLSSIESSVGSLKSQSGAFYEKNGVSDASVREFYTGVARENMLFEALYGEGGQYDVPEEELLRYFDENYAVVDAMPMYKESFSTEEDSKTPEELEAETKAAADDYLRRLAAGEAIEELMYEWQIKSSSSEDTSGIEKPEKGELRLALSESSRDNFGDALVDAARAAKAGVPQLVEDEYFYVVFNRIDPAEASDTFDMYKSLLLYELKNEEYFSSLDSWAASAAIEENSAALNRYKPEKLKLEDQ